MRRGQRGIMRAQLVGKSTSSTLLFDQSVIMIFVPNLRMVSGSNPLYLFMNNSVFLKVRRDFGYFTFLHFCMLGLKPQCHKVSCTGNLKNR